MASDPPANPPEGETFKHHDPIKDAALDWFLRLQASHDDERLKREFQAWLAEDRRHAQAFGEYETLWQMPELESVTARLAARQDRRLGRNWQRNNWKRSIRPRTSTLVAGLAVLVVAAGLQYLPAMMLRWQADHATGVGERDHIVLPDGSRMTLNTSSAVALEFRGSQRGVRLLEGEAFFDVVQDTNHPFRLTGTFGEVEVRGTAFAVRSENTGDMVVLESGSLLVSRLSDKADQVLLSPGEAVTVSSLSVSPVEGAIPENALAWVKGRIIFREKPFSQVIEELKRYRHGFIISLNRRHAGVLVSGNYALDNPEGVVRSLAEAIGASVTGLPGGILILQ